MTSLNLNIDNINKGYEDALRRGIDTPQKLYDSSFVRYLSKFIEQPFNRYELTQFNGLHEAAYVGILIAEACKRDKLEIEHLSSYHKAYIRHTKELFEQLSEIPIAEDRTYDFYPRFLHLLADSLCDHPVAFISPKSLQLVSNIKDLTTLTATQTATLIQNAFACAANIKNPAKIETPDGDDHIMFTINIMDNWLHNIPAWSQIKKELIEVSRLGVDITGNYDTVLNIVTKSGMNLPESKELHV